MDAYECTLHRKKKVFAIFPSLPFYAKINIKPMGINLKVTFSFRTHIYVKKYKAQVKTIKISVQSYKAKKFLFSCKYTYYVIIEF